MNMTAQTINDVLKGLQKSDLTSEILGKAFTQSGSATAGLTAYDLEAGAKLLYPVLTPLRNALPRVSGKGGIQAAWRAVTKINSTGISAGVGQGNRAGVIGQTVKEYTAAYRTIGHENYVTFEGELSAEGMEDLRALAAKQGLEALMMSEESLILGGNNSLALGTTPTPTVSSAATGGAIGAETYNVICVALSFEGYQMADLTLASADAIKASITRTNADGSTDTYGGGSANKSAAATTGALTGSTNTVSASVAAVAGAFAYAWFFGTAGNEVLAAITTINSVKLTAAATGTQNASTLAADNSRNQLVFDGFLTFCSDTANSGAYRYAMPTGTAGTGTPLTADTKGGVVEIDAALKSFWDNYRLSPDEIWVSAQEQTNISSKILEGSNTAAHRFSINADQGMIAGGTMVRSYLNKYSMAGAKEIPIKLHPNMPAGTILFATNRLPYPMSNVSNVAQIRARRDYYQIEWPLRTRKYEYGVYSDEVLQVYAPFAFGIITNIANG